MTLRDLYNFSIERGLALDPRGEDAIRQGMADLATEYAGLTGKAQALFDAERLSNPFGDTRILCGDLDTEVRRLVCGINIAGPELLMADRLADKGRPVDLVVGHHASAPGGVGSRRDTIWPQVKMLSDFGLPAHLAHKLVTRGAQGGPERPFDPTIMQVAAALGMPFMTIHSPADVYLLTDSARLLADEQPRTLADLVEITDAWPEVQWTMQRGKGTEIAVGDPKDPVGKVYACFYGGWNPTPEVFEALCDAGCGTLWVVDTSAELNEVARKRNVSIVVIPHCPADNYGINRLFDDAMDRFGDFDVVECSSYTRTDRRL